MRLQRRQGERRPERPAGRAAEEGGFTLIETAISLGVMMVAALGMAALFVHSINNNSGAGDRALAMAVAQQRVERLRSVEFDALTDENGVIESAGRSYQVTVTVTAVDTDDDVDGETLKRIQVSVTPLAANGEWADGPVVLWTERAALTLGDNR
jgi:type II secretion system protein I